MLVTRIEFHEVRRHSQSSPLTVSDPLQMLISLHIFRGGRGVLDVNSRAAPDRCTNEDRRKHACDDVADLPVKG